MTETYLDMMEDSLHKKIAVMQEIEKENRKQRQILEDGTDMEAFDDAVHAKSDLIDELDQLNEGFANLFDRTKQELEGNRDKYRDQIIRMQDLIRTITDLSNTLEVEENRNKDLADVFFSNTRKEMKQGKMSAAAAFNYHMTMNKSANIQPQFFDNHG